MLRHLTAILAGLGLFFAPLFLYAHSTGVSFEKVVGAYKVDIGYDPVSPQVGIAERFDFELLTNTGEEADFGDIWVRIMQGNTTIFASGIHRPYIGKATLLFTFPGPGTYTISARFEKNENMLAETSFDLPVSAASGGTTVPYAAVLGFAAGILLGALGVFLYVRNRAA